MSLLLRYVVKGLGWELGKTAAQEAAQKLRDGPDEAQPRGAETDADRRARDKRKAKARREAERAAAREAKRRAKEAKRRERELDWELASLKKRLGRD